MTAVWIALAAAGVAAVAAVVLVSVATRRREVLMLIAQLDYEMDQLERMQHELDRLTAQRQRATEAASLN